MVLGLIGAHLGLGDGNKARWLLTVNYMFYMKQASAQERISRLSAFLISGALARGWGRGWFVSIAIMS